MTNTIIKADPALGALPTVNTDETLGYSVLSIVAHNGRMFICRNPTDGAAIWDEFARALTPITDANASVTLLPTHHNCKLRLTNAAPALTIAPQASQTYPDGFYCEVVYLANGTLIGGAAVDINDATAETFNVTARPNRIALERLASNDWEATGGLVVAP